MSDLVNVKGLKELQAFLDQLPAKMEANIMRSAMRAGANVVKNAAQANLAANNSVKTGSLRKSMRVTTSRLRNGKIVAKIKTHSDIINNAIWVEYGTAAHYIEVPDEARPVRKNRNGKTKMVSMKMLNKMVNSGSLVIGGNFVGPSVYHPGATPKPYMRPALDNNVNKVLLAVGEAIKRRLNKRGINASGIELVIEPDFSGIRQ